MNRTFLCLLLVFFCAQLIFIQAFIHHLPIRFNQNPKKSLLKMKASGIGEGGKHRIMKAFQIAFLIKPPVGDFPYLAEVLHRTGVQKNIWTLPGCSSLYQTTFGDYALNIPPLIPEGISSVPSFNRDLVLKAIRDDQAGKMSFYEFLVGIWDAGIVKYDVDFTKRVIIYYGINPSDFYEEEYPTIDIVEKIEDVILKQAIEGLAFT